VHRVGRRTVFAAAAGIAAARVSRAAAAPAAPYRVAVIGHTGRGNYGHGLDTVWLSVPHTRIVAVADADEGGRAQAVRRLKAPKGYADWRRMIEEERPDLISIGPRWLDQHHDMVVGAAERGVRGIYLEKPLCPTLAEADAMVEACEKHRVQVAVAHQTRYSPKLAVVCEIIRSGTIGRVLEFRGRGKEDRRGGGEDLWVLGTHVLDLIHALGGTPRSCVARVRVGGRPVGPRDVAPGNEGIGPLAGDEVHAVYELAGGAMAHFDSVRDAGGNPTRFGVTVYGSRGVIEMGTGFLPAVHLLTDASWSPGRTGSSWVPVSSQGAGKPEPLRDGGLDAGNVLAVRDLIAAVEENRRPLSSIHDARIATEMIVAVFASHCTGGGPVALPLAGRGNPLSLLE